MNKTVVYAASLGVFVAAGCAYAAPERDEIRDVAPFTKIVASGHYSIDVREGSEQLVVLSGAGKDLDRIKTEVRGDTLYIEKKRGTDPGRVAVAVDVETLEALSVGGRATGRLSGLGGGDFDLSLAGSVELRASGNCRDAVMEMAGSIKLDARELACDRLQISIAGSGDAAVHATEEVTMSIAGSGRLDVYGNPDRVIPTKFSGSASVNLK